MNHGGLWWCPSDAWWRRIIAFYGFDRSVWRSVLGFAVFQFPLTCTLFLSFQRQIPRFSLCWAESYMNHRFTGFFSRQLIKIRTDTGIPEVDPGIKKRRTRCSSTFVISCTSRNEIGRIFSWIVISPLTVSYSLADSHGCRDRTWCSVASEVTQLRRLHSILLSLKPMRTIANIEIPSHGYITCTWCNRASNDWGQTFSMEAAPEWLSTECNDLIIYDTNQHKRTFLTATYLLGFRDEKGENAGKEVRAPPTICPFLLSIWTARIGGVNLHFLSLD